MEPNQIYKKAVEQATAAKLKYFTDGGREAPFNCGFAWVEVRPARGAFVTWCKQQGVGRKGYSGGWHFWGPGAWPTAEQAGVDVIYGQDMDVNLAGARAFAAVLREYGLDAIASYRLD